MKHRGSVLAHGQQCYEEALNRTSECTLHKEEEDPARHESSLNWALERTRVCLVWLWRRWTFKISSNRRLGFLGVMVSFFVGASVSSSDESESKYQDIVGKGA